MCVFTRSDFVVIVVFCDLRECVFGCQNRFSPSWLSDFLLSARVRVAATNQLRILPPCLPANRCVCVSECARISDKDQF